MEGTDTYLMISIVFMVISLLVIVSGHLSKKEQFDPKYETDRKTFVDNYIYTPENPNVMSNGTIQKYKIDGEYVYEFVYNLPDAVATLQVVDLNKSFNADMPKNKYTVFAGISDTQMEHIGELTRRGDGNHVLYIKSNKDYKKACIVLGNDVIQCTDITRR
mgnify:CR=1 FL=1